MPSFRAILLLVLLSAPLLAAGSLIVTVKDPQGALVGGATVEVTGQEKKSTDIQGRATFDPLSSGAYRVVVTRDGFETLERSVTVADKAMNLAVSLKLSAVTSSIQVSGKRSPLANSDPNYKAIRQGRLTTVYRVNNLKLSRDTGTFTFRSGSFSFLPPVLGHVTTGVFVGDGNFQLKPAFDLAQQHLHRMMGADAVDEDFTATVIYFSDSTFDEIKQHAELADVSAGPHEEALKRVRQVIETRVEPPPFRPLTTLERMLNFEDIPNYDAEILEELYNAEPGGSFRAFIHGKKHSDLRFLLNPHGAMPTLPAPEEVALLNFEPSSDSDGIWYLSHTVRELQGGHANSNEDKRLIEPEHYKIESLVRNENLVGNHPDLAVTCELKFRALQNGVRMVKFDMVPDLQVSRAAFNGSDIPFVQEARGHDGSFYLQMPEALSKGRTYDVTFEYAGGEILQSKFGVPLRRIWYPTPAGPANRATYDLIFRIPHGGNVVTVGKLANQTREGRFDVQEWTSNIPIQQAVFRYLDDSSATHKTEVEEETNTPMSLWVATGGRGALPPSMKDLFIDTGNALRVFNAWFGKPAYDDIQILVGGGYDSVPGLVVVPPALVAGYSSLASQIMVGRRGNGPLLNPRARVFLDEAFPTSVSRQWWGNTVSPVSFHDQWLVQGLANFSASLFDSAANDEYKDHWTMARESVLVAGRWGKANLAGPVWMGMLNDVGSFPNASGPLNTSKGGYILQMLRSFLWDPQKGDEDFQAMLQDFLTQYRNRAVSTEDFRAVVEKHMKPIMDLDRNHRMDWFFREWLNTTDVPSYKLEYSVKPDGKGHFTLAGKLTQRNVAPDFKMLVPVFGDFAGRKERIFVAAIVGSAAGDFHVTMGSAPKKILLNINHDILTDKDEVVLMK